MIQYLLDKRPQWKKSHWPILQSLLRLHFKTDKIWHLDLSLIIRIKCIVNFEKTLTINTLYGKLSAAELATEMFYNLSTRQKHRTNNKGKQNISVSEFKWLSICVSAREKERKRENVWISKKETNNTNMYASFICR